MLAPHRAPASGLGPLLGLGLFVLFAVALAAVAVPFALRLAKVAEERRRRAKEAKEAEAIQRAAKRWERLARTYGEATARRIVDGKIWQGMTRAMVIEALGSPSDVNEEVLKTKTKHVLKFYQIASNRYALHVMLENGIVVGWKD